MNDQVGPEASIRGINQAIDSWLEVVDKNPMDRLLARPPGNKWSLGQLCNHLLEATDYFFDQVEACMSSDEFWEEEMSPAARILFRNNGFPDQLIEGPPSNADTPQPGNKEGLVVAFNELRQRLSGIGARLPINNTKGKTRHPGLEYFNAGEWLQFSEMHFRHHLRQKRRIEEFLDTIGKDPRFRRKSV